MQMLNRFKGNDHVGTVVGHSGKFLSVALRMGEVFGDEMLVSILRRGSVDIETRALLAPASASILLPYSFPQAMSMTSAPLTKLAAYRHGSRCSNSTSGLKFARL
jgi:hypothetical protein